MSVAGMVTGVGIDLILAETGLPHPVWRLTAQMMFGSAE